MDKTKIEWANATVTPIRARDKATGKVGWFCEHATPGCEHCYSEAFNRRLGTGIDFKRQNRDRVEIFLDDRMLTQPLRWKRPRRIFWNSMTDTFGDFVPDEFIDRQFAVMALTPQHTHLVLTKRAERMREYLSDEERCGEQWCRWTASILGGRDPGEAPEWPLKNCWLGVSVEDQQRADERIPDLLATPAAKRFISAEPLLGPIDLRNLRENTFDAITGCGNYERLDEWEDTPSLDWVIAGGESGPGARPFDIAWARSLIEQCRAAGAACFVKQLGARPFANDYPESWERTKLRDKKGGDWSEWPEELRVREMPA